MEGRARMRLTTIPIHQILSLAQQFDGETFLCYYSPTKQGFAGNCVTPVGGLICGYYERGGVAKCGVQLVALMFQRERSSAEIAGRKSRVCSLWRSLRERKFNKQA
jgi:hypothetical protein